MGRRLYSIAVWTVTGTVVLFWLPLLAAIFAVTAPFDPGRYTAGRWFRRAAIVAVKLNPMWKFRTSGIAIPDPRRPYVAAGPTS